jgi:hypothetical protein
MEMWRSGRFLRFNPRSPFLNRSSSLFTFALFPIIASPALLIILLGGIYHVGAVCVYPCYHRVQHPPRGSGWRRGRELEEGVG